MREFWFESDDTRLFAVEDGAGQPIIMAHGGLANHLASFQMIAALASQFRVVAPDLRASGKSWDANALTWDLLADDLATLMQYLKLSRAVVGGVSSGSGLALRFALRYPDKVAGLVIVSPVYGGQDRGLTAEQAAIFKMLDDTGRRAVTEGVQALRPLYANLPAGARERAWAMIEGFDAKSIAATTRFLSSGAQPFGSVSELRNLNCPALLILGNDALHPSEVGEIYSNSIPNRQTLAANVDVAQSIKLFCESRARW